LEELVDLGFCGNRSRGSVGGIAAYAKAADAEGLEELDERTIAGDKVSRSAVGMRQKGESFEAEAEEVWGTRGGRPDRVEVEPDCGLCESGFGIQEHTKEKNRSDVDGSGED
jgi:hypothetical protein